jgi:hypothetical protein
MGAPFGLQFFCSLANIGHIKAERTTHGRRGLNLAFRMQANMDGSGIELSPARRLKHDLESQYIAIELRAALHVLHDQHNEA